MTRVAPGGLSASRPPFPVQPEALRLAVSACHDTFRLEWAVVFLGDPRAGVARFPSQGREREYVLG
jgi:hypothetical protein